MVFHCTLELEGSLNPNQIRKAWQETMRCHQRLRGRMVGRGVRSFWKVEPPDEIDAFYEIDFDPNTPDANLPAPCVRRSYGACVIYSKSARCNALRIRFHHSVCDGVGAARILGDFLKHLGNAQYDGGSGKSLQGSPRLKQAVESPKCSSAAIPNLKNTWNTIRGRNVDVRRDAHLHGDADKDSGSDRRVPVEKVSDDTWMFSLSDERSASLSRFLRREKIPLNDFGVAALAVSLANLTDRARGARTHVMVMNPVQMRRWSERRDSANSLGFAFLRRIHDQLSVGTPESAIDLLQSIHQECHAVRTQGIAGELLYGIEVAERLPGTLELIERLGWFRPTASLTCLSSIRFARRYGVGEGKTIASAKIDRIILAAPLQAGGQLAATVWDLGQHIQWSLRFAPEISKQECHAQAIANAIAEFGDLAETIS